MFFCVFRAIYNLNVPLWTPCGLVLKKQVELLYTPLTVQNTVCLSINILALPYTNLGAVCLYHMAEHEERNVKEQGSH